MAWLGFFCYLLFLQGILLGLSHSGVARFRLLYEWRHAWLILDGDMEGMGL
uniref:Uncharacterized protein n=1 Tax=Candidatus Nitrotoga fabula TaxID=2182327 RepID=A0A2X0SD77_9PROT|nr:protein of unknown function [Candidatus Nitrotoga fabula]